MQPRALVAQASRARGTRCAPLTTPLACKLRSPTTCSTTATVACSLVLIERSARARAFLCHCACPLYLVRLSASSFSAEHLAAASASASVFSLPQPLVGYTVMYGCMYYTCMDGCMYYTCMYGYMYSFTQLNAIAHSRINALKCHVCESSSLELIIKTPPSAQRVH